MYLAEARPIAASLIGATVLVGHCRERRIVKISGVDRAGISARGTGLGLWISGNQATYVAYLPS